MTPECKHGELPERAWTNLAAAYREACPDVEPGVEFMPRLWARIEARQGFHRKLERLTRRWVMAAGCACLVLASLLAFPEHLTADDYVDILASVSPAAEPADPDVLDVEDFDRR